MYREMQGPEWAGHGVDGAFKEWGYQDLATRTMEEGEKDVTLLSSSPGSGGLLLAPLVGGIGQPFPPCLIPYCRDLGKVLSSAMTQEVCDVTLVSRREAKSRACSASAWVPGLGGPGPVSDIVTVGKDSSLMSTRPPSWPAVWPCLHSTGFKALRRSGCVLVFPFAKLSGCTHPCFLRLAQLGRP